MNQISSVSPNFLSLYRIIGADALLAPIPSGLGFPSEVAQSSYYPANLRISRQEIAAVATVLEAESIYAENTRIRKCVSGNSVSYDLLQASVAVDTDEPQRIQTRRQELEGIIIRIIRGDHSDELKRICECLEEAQKYAGNPLQERFLSEYMESFTSGNIEAYKSSQRTWIKGVQPSVETVLGFVEPYRDPFGVRAEFEGLVGIVHRGETEVLTTLVKNSTKFIRRLP